MPTDPAAKAREAADQLYKALDHPDELAALTASALLDAAQAAARTRPTPQAPMVAVGFSVSGDTIKGPSGTLGELTMGAEFGSLGFAQFGPRHGSGSWLFPTLANPPASVEQQQEDWLDEAAG